jgi:hypothetical protein
VVQVVVRANVENLQHAVLVECRSDLLGAVAREGCLAAPQQAIRLRLRVTVQVAVRANVENLQLTVRILCCGNLNGAPAQRELAAP